MNHLDLCSGIGGFALAAKWNGYETIGFCEIDPWCRRVLAKHWPGVPQHDDLWTLTGDVVRDWIGDADRRAHVDANQHGESASALDGVTRSGKLPEPSISLITGGYPCQPFSLAGKRLGEKDDRHLWPAIAALVADLRPAKCLFENVSGHITMGLDAVLSDLESLGYAVWPVVIPAAAVGAPHRRDRVWILADSERGGRRELMRTDATQGALPETVWREGASGTGSSGADVADSHGARCEGHGRTIGTSSEHTGVGPTLGRERGDGAEALGGAGQQTDGLSRWVVGPGRLNPWAGDWEAGCPRTTTHEQDRTNKLKALGNAIVPQVAYEILRAWNEQRKDERE